MRYRVTFVAGLAIGFLAGARAGRERYEQIVKLARQAAGHPAVQQATKTITVKTTEYSKSAAAQMPKLAGAAKSKAGDQLGRLPGGKTGKGNKSGKHDKDGEGKVPEPRKRSDSPSVNGARAAKD
jgi:hypothetical protein